MGPVLEPPVNVYDLLEDWMRERLYSCGIEGDVPWAVAKSASTYVGGWNGYAWCPDAHPWADTQLSQWIDNEGVPWGELTYRGKNWVGFDAGHSGQWWPDGNQTKWDSDEVMTVEKIVEWAKMTARNVAKASDTLENRALTFEPTETDLMYLDLLAVHKKAKDESRSWEDHEITRLMSIGLIERGWTRP